MTQDADRLYQDARGFSADMSPAAIAKRIDLMAQLCELAHEMGQAKPVDRLAEEPAEYRKSREEGRNG